MGNARKMQGKMKIRKVTEMTENMEKVETCPCSFNLKSRWINFTQLLLLTYIPVNQQMESLIVKFSCISCSCSASGHWACQTPINCTISEAPGIQSYTLRLPFREESIHSALGELPQEAAGTWVQTCTLKVISVPEKYTRPPLSTGQTIRDLPVDA